MNKIAWEICLLVAAIILTGLWIQFSPPSGFIVWCILLTAVGRIAHRLICLRWPRVSRWTVFPFVLVGIFVARDHYFAEPARGSALFFGVLTASVAVGGWAAELFVLWLFPPDRRDTHI
jgi:hypothetical protein